MLRVYPSVLAFVFALASLADAQNLAAYKCDPAVCLPPACRCASTSPPIANPPQFLLLTFDDSIQADLYSTAMQLLNHKNPNGCSARATWYAQVFYSDPYLAQQWYAMGNEIADHSVTHVSPFAGSTQELDGMRQYFATYGGIPRGKINGVRFPFRNYTLRAIEDLARMNFTYDSSMTNSDADPLWPYTMDFGVVSDCTSTQSLCGTTVNAKGLWELPMAENVGPGGAHLMDPFNDPVVTAPITTQEAVQGLTASFNARYRANRAPFGLYLHPVWYGKAQPPSIPDGAAKLAAANEFLKSAMSNPDVWMVTGQQVIEYMKNPVPASELGKQPYMQCPTPPPQICNGLTASLAQTCNLVNGTIRSCFGCPTTYPSLENPNPARQPENPQRCLVPDNCDGVYWDPVGCKCLCTTGACSYSEPKPSPTAGGSVNGTPTSSNNPTGTNSTRSGSVKVGIRVDTVLISFIIAVLFSRI